MYAQGIRFTKERIYKEHSSIHLTLTQSRTYNTKNEFTFLNRYLVNVYYLIMIIYIESYLPDTQKCLVFVIKTEI